MATNFTLILDPRSGFFLIDKTTWIWIFTLETLEWIFHEVHFPERQNHTQLYNTTRTKYTLSSFNYRFFSYFLNIFKCGMSRFCRILKSFVRGYSFIFFYKNSIFIIQFENENIKRKMMTIYIVQRSFITITVLFIQIKFKSLYCRTVHYILSNFHTEHSISSIYTVQSTGRNWNTCTAAFPYIPLSTSSENHRDVNVLQQKITVHW